MRKKSNWDKRRELMIKFIFLQKWCGAACTWSRKTMKKMYKYAWHTLLAAYLKRSTQNGGETNIKYQMSKNHTNIFAFRGAKLCKSRSKNDHQNFISIKMSLNDGKY